MAKAITNADLDKRLSLLEQKVDSGHDALRQQVEGSYKIIIEKLTPLDDLKKSLEKTQAEVADHASAISWMKGVGTTISAVFTLFLGFLTYLKAAHK